MSEDVFAALRAEMVEVIAVHALLVADKTGKNFLDAKVLEAMGQVPRHEFVRAEHRAYAYADMPLPIGSGKTISQPFIVALMADLLQLESDDSVLEIGTGLGYQCAVLAKLAGRVYTVEIIEELAQEGRRRLVRQGYRNVEFKVGNGYHGWPEHGPYDKIIVTAAPDLIPAPLIRQLKPGGKMVIPTGIPDAQQLVLAEKSADGRLSTRDVLAVRFSELELDGGETPGLFS